MTPPNAQQNEAAVPYRPDIDGLRAVSIVAVVAYHAGLPFAPGGFVGVDVFFVISGYLITGLLAKELIANGRIDLLKFWARRIRRLLPSAFIVIVVSAALAMQILPPYDVRTAGEDLVAASTYFLNWQLAQRAVEYLAEDERHSLYLHFWSLSVEEQFYVLWPIIMIGVGVLASRMKQPDPGSVLPALAATVVVSGLCSLAIGFYFTALSQPLAFFGTVSRAWQLLAGALIAVAPIMVFERASRRILAWGGMLLIVLAILLYSRDTPYPGLAAVTPVLGAAMIVLAGHCQTHAQCTPSWLSWPSTVFVGRISYAWYLWHWPVLLLGDVYFEGATAWQASALVSVSFVLAIITYYLIEQPIRFAPALSLSSAPAIAIGIFVTATGTLVGLGLQTTRGDETIALASGNPIDPQQIRADIPRIYRDGCHLGELVTQPAGCVYGEPASTRTVVLFGDSHAAQWFPALDAAARASGWRLVSRTKSACPSIDIRVWNGKLKREYSECTVWRNAVVAEIGRLNPELVILANQSRYKPIAGNRNGTPRAQARLKGLREGEIRLVESIRRISLARLVLVRDTPVLPESPLDCLFRRRKLPERCAWPRHLVLGADTFPLASYATLGGVSTLNLSDLVCGPDFCSALKDGRVVMRDSHHLTATFAQSLAEQFRRLLGDEGQ